MYKLIAVCFLLSALCSVSYAASSGPAGPDNVYQKESPFGTPPISVNEFAQSVKNVKFTVGGYARTRYAYNPVAATVPAEFSALGGEHDAVEELAEFHSTASYKHTSFHAGVFLTHTNLTGLDHQPNNTSRAQRVNTPDGNFGGDRATLDYAYLSTQLPFKINFEIGRIPESYGGYGFTDNNTRRDRAIISRDFDGYITFFSIDKRNAGVEDPYGVPVADINSGSDAFIGVLHHMRGKHYSLTWSGIYLHFQGDTATESYTLNSKTHKYQYNPGTRRSDFALAGTNEVSDWIEGKVYGYDVMFAHNYFGGGDGGVFAGGSNAYAIRLGHVLPDKFHFDLEWTQVLSGGFVQTGFDTMSSVINNNPDYDQSATRIIQLGGLGGVPGTPNEERFDQWLIMSKLSYRPTDAWLFTAGVGRMRRHGGYQTGYELNPAEVFQGVANDIVYDIQARYQLNELVDFAATWGRVNGINHPDSYTGPLDAYAVSASVGIKF